MKVNEVRIERRPYQYSYKDEMGYHFLHTETWEEIVLPGESIEGVAFLKDGDIVEAMVHAASETVLTCELPANVVLEIQYTEPGIIPPPTHSNPPLWRQVPKSVCPFSAISATKCVWIPAQATTWSA